MTAYMDENEFEITRTIAERCRRDGYMVNTEPSSADVPFDLGGYRPDIIAERDGQHYIVEVKKDATRLSLDRFERIASGVSAHPGWQFVLVTSDDAESSTTSSPEPGVMQIGAVRAYLKDAEELLSRGASETAVLVFWAAIEGLLRRKALAAHVPAERLPVRLLLKHLYSHGEVSMEQFDALSTLLRVRNDLAHGFGIRRARSAAESLCALARELLASPDDSNALRDNDGRTL